MDFGTNAVDSFVVEKIGEGSGECKIYLKGSRDKYYKDYFEIDAKKYGRQDYPYNGTTVYRDKGNRICKIDKNKTSDYLSDLLDQGIIDQSDYELGRNILESISGSLFDTNYLYDSQNRCYIRSKAADFFKLRDLCIGRTCIIYFNKDADGNIEIYLKVGQI